MVNNIAHQWCQPLNTIELIIQELRVIPNRRFKEYLDNDKS